VSAAVEESVQAAGFGGWIGAFVNSGFGREAHAQSETALIRAAQDGSEEALASLFAAHWPRAHRAAWLIVRDPVAAEDIAQEAMLAAIRALDRFDRRRPFAPWLHRIVVNRAIDWSRARALRHEVSSEGLPEPVDPDAGRDRDRLSDEVMRALTDLPPESRAVVVLRYLLGYTPGEISRMLELRRGTVNSRIRRALDRLAEDLEEVAG
jgi:RNA polymerase sigma-70 factor, ECF subfamily